MLGLNDKSVDLACDVTGSILVEQPTLVRWNKTKSKFQVKGRLVWLIDSKKDYTHMKGLCSKSNSYSFTLAFGLSFYARVFAINDYGTSASSISGWTNTFRVRVLNSFGYSQYSPALNLLAAFVSNWPTPLPTSVILTSSAPNLPPRARRTQADPEFVIV